MYVSVCPRLQHFSFASCEAFTAVMFQVEVFWVVTLYSVVVGCQQHLRGQYPATTLHSDLILFLFLILCTSLEIWQWQLGWGLSRQHRTSEFKYWL